MSATNLTSLRVDIAGSFLRPARLKELFGRQQQGTGDAVELQECLDSSVREVIRQQECRGLPVVTDGEFRRVNFQDSFAASVKGFPLLARTFVGSPTASAASASRDSLPPGAMRVVVTERLELAENLPLREYQLASAMANVPVKVTVVGIERLLSRFDEPSADAIYPSRVAFAEALITVQREIIGQLIEAGCRYIQIDEPGYTGYVDLPTLDWLREQGRDPTEQLQAAIDGDNRIIAGWPAEVTFGVHVCRGNARSKWHREGAYDGIAERLFGNLAHHRLLLEYDTERAGSFEPLRFVPPDKIAVLGLISTKTPRVESVEELRRRIDEASRYLPIERLAISPQCGFASEIGGNLLSEDDQWRKIEVMMETARLVWGATA